MMINEAVLPGNSIAQLDADGIRLRQDDKAINDAEFFLSYEDLRALNALAEALGKQAHYNQLRDYYGGPSPHLGPLIDPIFGA